MVVDNYDIHHSKKTQKAIEALSGKIVLHYLPPYSPDYNPIERVWRDLHAAVTRNHRHPDMASLLAAVDGYLTHYDKNGGAYAGKTKRAA
jgi:transposase